MMTDEQVTSCWEKMGRGIDKYATFARAIEAEVRKEQADKIAELTRQLAEALKDAKVYAAIFVYGTEAVFPNGPATTDAEMMAAIDSATRALNESAAIKAKEQP